jgi:hypothetical protein
MITLPNSVCLNIPQVAFGCSLDALDCIFTDRYQRAILAAADRWPSREKGARTPEQMQEPTLNFGEYYTHV